MLELHRGLFILGARLDLFRTQGTACNVSRPADVAALANYAKDQLGGIDIWHVIPQPLGKKFGMSSTVCRNKVTACLQGEQRWHEQLQV